MIPPLPASAFERRNLHTGIGNYKIGFCRYFTIADGNRFKYHTHRYVVQAPAKMMLKS